MATRPDAIKDTDTYDLVVVGCGIAGLSAAVTAAEDDARVVVLERSTYEKRGGNSRYTEAYLRMEDEEHVADHFVDDLLTSSLGYSDAQLARFLAEAIPPSIAWLREHGVRFTSRETQFLSQSRPRLLPDGGGLAIVEALTAAAERLGVTFLFETAATALIQDQRGEVVGVRARARDRGLTEIRGQAVLLASGGFEGNTEMLARYFGPDAFHLRPIARGSRFNKGEGIEMGLAIGAEPSGQFDSFHAEPIDPRSEVTEATVMVYPYGILVNRLGQRFVDEGRTTVDHWYETVAREIRRQPESIAYFVTDQRLFDIRGYRRGLRTDQPLIEAPRRPSSRASWISPKSRSSRRWSASTQRRPPRTDKDRSIRSTWTAMPPRVSSRRSPTGPCRSTDLRWSPARSPVRSYSPSAVTR